MPARPILLLIPPLTQLNTPYPSTAYLTGFLRSRGVPAVQADLGLEMMLRVFSRRGVEDVFHAAAAADERLSGEARQMLALRDAYLATIEPVVSFLQGRDPMLAPHVSRLGVLPEGPRFAAWYQRDALHGARMAVADAARYRATLYLEDLMDLVRETVTPYFALNRYAERVGRSASSFHSMEQALRVPPTLTDQWLLECLWRHVEQHQPSVVGLSVPFPGNLFGAFRIAQAIKARRPDISVVLGGGFINTELRKISDATVFDYVDYITLDDGERPLLCLLEHMDGHRDAALLCRTFRRHNGVVTFHNGCREPDVSPTEQDTPTYDGLPLDRYLSILDSVNPMHRLWSEGHWNKLTVAHGCYWKQCTFCDVGLDYIARYEATPTTLLVDRVETLIHETGRRGFHFVDEAAPPAGLKALALALLERRLMIAWWTNIRFERAFTPDLCRLLAASGCIAVSAGLEAASDRLLAAMQKGITVDDTAVVAAALRQAGILVHAYLMYGYPGQTLQEVVDSLERVRQLFSADLLQSAFWHEFVATAHSPIGLAPRDHGVIITGPPFSGFAENDLLHRTDDPSLPDWIGPGLRHALFNFMEGHGLARDVRGWFAHPVAASTVNPGWLRQVRTAPETEADGAHERRVVWIGETPVVRSMGRKRAHVILPARTDDTALALPAAVARWLLSLIEAATPRQKRDRATCYPRFAEARTEFEAMTAGSFEVFAKSTAWRKIRRAGLLLV